MNASQNLLHCLYEGELECGRNPDLHHWEEREQFLRLAPREGTCAECLEYGKLRGTSPSIRGVRA